MHHHLAQRADRGGGPDLGPRLPAGADHPEGGRVGTGQRVDGQAAEPSGTTGAQLLADRDRPDRPGPGVVQHHQLLALRVAEGVVRAEAVPLADQVPGGEHHPPPLSGAAARGGATRRPSYAARRAARMASTVVAASSAAATSGSAYSRVMMADTAS